MTPWGDVHINRIWIAIVIAAVPYLVKNRRRSVVGYWVYIVTNEAFGTLYAGVTNDLLGRVAAHRSGKGSAFTARYGLKRLVWFEAFATPRYAIQREKTIKHYPRDWKLNLIQRDNPNWEDLFPKLMDHHKLSIHDLRVLASESVPSTLPKR